MPSKSFSKGSEVYISASATLCLPLVQKGAKGILFLRHDSPFTFALRVFRQGALIWSSASTSLSTVFDQLDLRFSEIPRNLVFDIVVTGYISPLAHYLVFPLYLNVSWKRESNFVKLIIPGSTRVDWKANLTANVIKVALRERHLYGRKTVWVSQSSSNFGVSYG